MTAVVEMAGTNPAHNARGFLRDLPMAGHRETMWKVLVALSGSAVDKGMAVVELVAETQLSRGQVRGSLQRCQARKLPLVEVGQQWYLSPMGRRTTRFLLTEVGEIAIKFYIAELFEKGDSDGT